jgi:glycosyltransferase involved in cell wall biosynthesis
VINVLFVESGRNGGGSFESLYQHLRVIDRTKFRPVVACLNHTRLVPLIDDLGIPVYVLTDWLYSRHAPRLVHWVAPRLMRRALWLDRVLPSSYLRTIRLIHWPLINELTRIVYDDDIGVIHLNVQIFRDLFGVMVSNRTGVPCVSHLRSAIPGNARQLSRRISSFANRSVVQFIANKEHTAALWIENGVDRAKTRVAYNGMPLHEIAPLDIRQTWGISDKVDYLVGCVTPLRNPLKVNEFLVRAFARFLEIRPNAALLVVGDGPMKSVLVQEAAALGIEDKVIFTGFQQGAKEIIAGLDVSLVMHSHDSLSRVLLETMQARTPLVATDVGGVREIVQHEVNGLLIPYGDEEAFANAMERLAGDDALRSRLVENAYQTVAERFSIERYASEMEEVYETVLGEKVEV